MAKKEYHEVKSENGISFACAVIDTGTGRPEVAIRPAEKVEGDVVVPAQVEIEGTSYPVTVIEENAFSRMGMRSVSLPDTIIRIEESAFYNCEHLREVYLGKSLLRIGDSAFEDCKWLVYMPMPDTVIQVGYHALEGTRLVETQSGVIYLGHILYGYNGYLPEHSYIEVREGTTVIADSAFNSKFEYRYDCKNLEGVVLPAGIKRIGSSAFYMCRNLTHVNLPKSLEYIGGSAFNATNVREVTAPWRSSAHMARIGGVTFDDYTVIKVPKGTAEIYSKEDGWGDEWQHYQFIEK